MANQTLRGRGGTGAPRQRAVAAAARAAAKRAERTRGTTGPTGSGGPTEPTEPTGPAEEPSPRPAAEPARRRGLLTPALAVLTLLGLAATATLGLQHREAGRTAEARTAALAAARKAAPVILSYDYRHLDRDFRAARSHLTAPFLGQYSKTTTSVVAPTAKKYRGVVKATVASPPGGDAPAASVVSATPDKAVVLLFMNQATTSTQISGPRLDLNRVRMTLVRTPRGWKVGAVDAL
ncbi:hypothetical protein [Streptomyces sp. MNU89]|uniref:hypothetical protein n=1 Tax=Streptomyces sp. MNU89 TaxID=2560025 RepID=UPI001E3D4888|nr:hypothetical protein [Streptomyces sp. MNU89]MCC9739631.1 hypothetical protein [Streptomyces sp. MNU89]